MHSKLSEVLRQLESIILGKKKAIRLAVACLLARGHLLIEDIPGVGKTTLARALAKSLGLDLRRIQFTSDLLPADILGTSIFDREKQSFAFHSGPIFSELILADEVNRATPKTQSALLEAMEEEQVTVDGQTYALPKPFFVIATQNPHHLVGTYPLPESQLDRFLMKIELGFPDRSSEREMLSGPSRRDMIHDIISPFSPSQIVELQAHVSRVHVSDGLLEYLLDILDYTRKNSQVSNGLSPRSGMALQRAAQAWAFMEGREMVLPEDVQTVASSVMAHRLRTVRSDGNDPSGNIFSEKVLKAVPVPA